MRGDYKKKWGISSWRKNESEDEEVCRGGQNESSERTDHSPPLSCVTHWSLLFGLTP